ncbi:golgin subfamily B member 1-like [Acropora muricata]|uniref:golgin subfamily B member 1-like n=1 Tax=Acropora muricata TaxID=159855 RepID=UPI0034E48A53
MSAEGTMQLSGQEIYYDGGFISKAAMGCGQGQELETTMQAMKAIEAQSGGIMKQEMQLEMNGQLTEMEVISMEGGVKASHEMSVGMIVEQTMQLHNLQSESADGVFYLENGEIQESGIVLQQMSLEMDGTQKHTQKMNEGISLTEEEGLQMNETITQEGNFVEGSEIQMSAMSMLETGCVELREMGMTQMSLEMNGTVMQIREMSLQDGQEISFSQGGELQSEVASQETGIVEITGIDITAIPLEIHGEQLQMSEVAMGELTLEILGQEMQMQEVAIQEIPQAEGELQMSETAIQEAGFVESGEIQMTEMSMSEMTFEISGQEMLPQEDTVEGIPLADVELLMSETAIQEVGFVESEGNLLSEMSMSEMTFQMSGQEMLTREETIQDIPPADEELQMCETAIQEVIVVESGENQLSEMSMSEMTFEMSGQEILLQEETIQDIYPAEGELQMNQTAIQEVGYVESGENLLSEMSMSEMTFEMSGREMLLQEETIQEIPLVEGELQMNETAIQDVGFVESGEAKLSEMSMSEMTFEMSGQEMLPQEETIQKIPLEEGELQMNETAIQEVGFVESGEAKLSEMSMSEMTFYMSGQEMLLQEETIQEIPLVEGELQMNETAIQEVGFVESGEAKLSEMSMSEMTFDMSGQEMLPQEETIQEIQMNETAIQEVGFVEAKVSEISMTEMTFDMSGQEMLLQEETIQEIPPAEGELQMSETAVQEGRFVESGETRLSDMSTLETNFEISCQELLKQDVSAKNEALVKEEFQVNETMINEMGFTEREVQASEISMTEVTLEINGQEMLTQQDVSVEKIPSEEDELQTNETVMSQEKGIAGGGQIQTNEMSLSEMSLEISEQQMEMPEVSIQEISSERKEVTIQEMPLQGVPLKIKNKSVEEMPESTPEKLTEKQEQGSQDTSIQETREETSVTEIAFEMQEERTSTISAEMKESWEVYEGEIQQNKMAEQQMPSKVQQTEITKLASKEQTMPEQSINEMLIEAIPMMTTGQEVRILSAEMTIEEFPIDTTRQVVQEIESSESQSSEASPTKEQTKETITISDSVSKEKAKKARSEGKQSKGLPVKESVTEKKNVTTQEALSTYKKTELVDSATLESKEHENEKKIVEKVTCEHQLLIDQFLERISRLEKDKEYLERCYEELREKKETDIISREEQYTSRSEDHYHCCDIVKDYSTIVEYIASPREEQRRVHSYVHCSNDFAHDSRESTLFSNQVSDDHEYYKAKCEQIKREKERLERAYETEKRQKEELERDYNYRNETDDKNYLEERYREMSDSINRFEETIRSLRRDNEVLQKNLNDWANARVMPPTFELSSMVLENNRFGGDVEEYKRSIQALEKENREFRTILDVLSKKSESQESLKTIELGLARENEFIELKRERAKLESSIKEMKRTNAHLRERIEEIRRESTGEISRLNEKQRKVERTLKEKERIIQEKDEEFVNLKKRHLDEIQAMETRFQSDLSKEIIANNQIKDLQAKVRRMEEERSMLKEELRSSPLINRDRHSGIDMEQDADVVQQRYEEERRSKFRLATDMKRLLSDITELKERNLRLQEDFNRERMEIKGMIERQANEIIQEYVTQISKLQRSLIEETKRRQEAEASAFGAINNHYNSSYHSIGQKGTSVKTGWDKSDMQQELKDEIQRRESLEIENKKLLYKINEILSGEGNSVNETAFENENFESTSLSRNKQNSPSRSNKSREREAKQTALLNEIEDLQEKLEDMMKDAKRNKALKRRNEDLEEEITHLSRKRDELLASQRNLTREVDHLSRTLEEVERRNRKLTDDSECFTRRIQDIEDSFRQEKVTLARHHEIEKATVLEEVIKSKEACESKLQIQMDATKALEEKVRLLEGQGLRDTKGLGVSLSPHSTAGGIRNVSDNSENEGKQSQEEKLEQEVQRLEAKLRDYENKKHADEIRNLDLQRQQMSTEFRREKQALKHYFDTSSKSLQTRLSDVEETLQGGRPGDEEFEQGGEVIYGDSEIVRQGTRTRRGYNSIDTHEAVITTSSQWPSFAGPDNRLNPISLDKGAFTSTELEEIAPVQHGYGSAEHGGRFSRILGSHSPVFERTTELDQMYQIQGEVTFTERGEMCCGPTSLSREPRDTGEIRPIRRQSNATRDYRESPGQGDFEKRVQEMQRRFNDEKKTILNRENREKAKLEEKVREAQEKLASYRRQLEEEIANIKKEHKKEVDFLNDMLQKERADSGEKRGIHRNAMASKGSSPEFQSTHYLSEEIVNVAPTGGITTQEHEYRNKILTSKLEKEKSQFESEKKKFTDTIHALRNEINNLRNEKRDCKVCYKQEIEKLRRIHEVEKVTLLRRSARDKDEEIARINEDFKERLSTERKKSQTIFDDLRRKISSMERKAKDLEIHQANERLKLQEEKMAAEKRIIQTREDLKLALDRDYRKMLSDEKFKFDQTVKELTKQISDLQEQRKQIQEKLLNNELSAKLQSPKGNVMFQMEQEFLERASRERRTMEEKMQELQQEIGKLRREKSELRETMETEKRELEEDLEKIQEDTRRKVSKAREEMERRMETMAKTVMNSRVKSVQHSTNCEVQQYKDQINSMEQRNLTLKAKTERLERELRIVGERLQTLETRNKDLEASSREEWGGIRDDMLRSNNGYRGDLINREVSGYILGYNAAGPRSENRLSEMQARYSSGPDNTSGQTVLGTGESYKDIFERVRHTMHTTGSISDALGTSTNVLGGLSSINVVGSTNYGPQGGDNMVNGPLNHTFVGTQGSGIVAGAGYTGLNNVRFSSGQVNGNALQDVTRNAPYRVEGTNQASCYGKEEKVIKNMSEQEMQVLPMDDGWGNSYYMQPGSTAMMTSEMPLNDQGQSWEMEIVGTIPVDNSGEIESLKQRILLLEEEKKNIKDMYVKSVTEYETSTTKITQEYEIKIGQLKIERNNWQKKYKDSQREVQRLKQNISTMEVENLRMIEDIKREFTNKCKMEKSEMEVFFSSEKDEMQDNLEEQLQLLRSENEELMQMYQRTTKDYEVKIVQITQDCEVKLGQLKIDKEKLQKNISNLSAQIASWREKYANLESESEEELANLRIELTEMFHAEKGEMEVVYSKEKEAVLEGNRKAIEEYEVKITSLSQEYEEKLSELRNQKTQLEASYTTSSETTADLKRKYKAMDENYKMQMRELQDRLKTEYTQKENAIESEFDSEKQEILNKYKKMIQQGEKRMKDVQAQNKMLVMKMEKERTQLTEKYAAEIEAWKGRLRSLELKHKEYLKQMEKDLLQTYENEKEELEANFMTEKSELVESHKSTIQSYETKITGIQQEHDVKVAQMEQELERLQETNKSSVEKMEQEISLLKQNHEKQMKEVKDQMTEKYSKEKDDREDVFAKEMTALIDSHKTVVQEYEEKIAILQGEMEAQGEKMESELKGLKHSHQQALKALRKEMTDSEKQQNLKNKELKEKITENFRTERADMEANFQKTIEDLKAFNAAAIKTYEEKIVSIKDKYGKKCADFEGAMDKNEEKYKEKIQVLREEMSSSIDKYEKLLKDTKKELRQKHDKEKEEMENEFTQEKLKLTETHEEVVVDLQKRIANLQAEMKAKLEKWQDEREAVKEVQTKKEEELKQECKDVEETCKAKLLEVKASLKEKCVKEKNEIEANFDQEKEQLLERKSEIVKKYEMKIMELLKDSDKRNTQFAGEKEKLEAQKRKLQIQLDKLRKETLKSKEEYEANIRSTKQQMNEKFQKESSELEKRLKMEMENMKIQSNKKMQQLKTERDDITAKLEQVTQDFEKKISDLQQKSDSKITKIIGENEMLTGKLRDLERKTTEDAIIYEAETAKLRDEINKGAKLLEENKNRSEEDTYKFNEAIAKLRETLDEKIAEMESGEKNFERAKSNLKNALEDSESKIALLNKKIAELENERKHLINNAQNLQMTTKELVVSYEERIMKEKKDMEMKSSTEVSKLQEALNKEMQENRKLGIQLLEFAGEVKNWKTNYANLEEDKEKDIDDLRSKHEKEKCGQRKEYEDEIGSLRKKLDSQDATLEALEREKEDLARNVSEMMTTITELQDEVSNEKSLREKEILQGQNEIEALQDENRRLLSEKEKLRLKLADFEEYLSQNDAEQESALNAINLKIKEYESKLTLYSELQVSNQEMQNEIMRLGPKIEGLKSKETKLQEENANITLKVIELEQANKRLTQDIESLHKKVSDSEEKWNLEKQKLKENIELEKEKHRNEKQKLKEDSYQSEKVINELESEVKRLKTMIDSIGEEKKNTEHRLSIECGSLLEKYETERKTAGALRAELQLQISTFEEKSNEWKGQKDNMASKHKDDQDNFKKKVKDLEEDYERKMKELKEDAANEREICERKLIQLEQTYKDRINAVRDERDNYSREETKKTIENMRKEFEKEKTELQQTFQAEKRQLIDEFNSRIKENNEKFDRNKAQFKAEIDSLTATKYEMQNIIFDLERKIERTKEQLTYCFAEERRKLEYEFDAQTRETQEKHRLDLIKLSETEKQNMEAKFKTERKELEERIQLEYKASMASEISSREKQFQDSLYKLEQEFKTKRDKMFDIERSLKTENEVLMRDKQTLITQNRQEKEELSKRMDHEKKLMQVTLEAMSREVSKMREEKNFLANSFSMERKDIERKYESEVAEIRNRLEKKQQELLTRLHDEHKQSIEAMQRSSDMSISGLKEKLGKSERKIKEMEEYYRNEKSKSEYWFEHVKMELEQKNQTITQEVRITLEQEFNKRCEEKRKIQEVMVSNVRTEIKELRGSNARLDKALSEQRMLAFNLERDINLLKGGTRVSAPRKNEPSVLERELQELRYRNEKLKMATKEAQFFNNELVKWKSEKGCQVLQTVQELKCVARAEKPLVFEDYTVNETKDPETFDEAIGGGLHSSPRGEQQRPVLSLTSSNEDEPTRSLEQRVTSLKSNNAQLEKELVEMGERLDELEDRRINYLTQEGADKANQPGNYPASKQPKSTGFRVYSTGSNYRQSRLSSSMPSPPKIYK